MTKNINVLCYSRSYLSNFYPVLEQNDKKRNYYHIVQTNAEEKRVIKHGGKIMLNIQALIERKLKHVQPDELWDEPSDFRSLTDCSWSPVLSDRYLITFPKSLRERIAKIVFGFGSFYCC